MGLRRQKPSLSTVSEAVVITNWSSAFVQFPEGFYQNRHFYSASQVTVNENKYCTSCLNVRHDMVLMQVFRCYKTYKKIVRSTTTIWPQASHIVAQQFNFLIQKSRVDIFFHFVNTENRFYLLIYFLHTLIACNRTEQGAEKPHTHIDTRPL